MEGGSVAAGRLQIGRGEQRENDSGEKDEKPKQNAQVEESGLSSVFLFHGRNLCGAPLKLEFYANAMRDVTAIFRAFLCWVGKRRQAAALQGHCGDRKHSCELVFIRG